MADDVELAATSWTVDEIAGADVTGDVALTVVFDAAGGVGGHAGVNRFRGRYEQSGSSLEMGPIAVTQMAGPPPAMEQEQRFLAVLDAVDRVSGTAAVIELAGERDGVEVTLRLLAAPDESGAGGADDAPVGAHVLRGAVSYRERIPLPEGACVVVELVDWSAGDETAAVVAETRFEPAGQVPVDFELQVPADAVADTSRPLALQARIEADETVWWRSPEPHAVDHTTVDDRHDLWLTNTRNA